MRYIKIKHDKSDSWIAFIAILFFAIFSTSFETSGQGTFADIHFYSISLGMERNVQVYLPEEYNEQDSVRYPVIYFLHGATMDHTYYKNLLGILNTLIDEGQIAPVIIVKPDGSVGPWAGSFYTNSELYGNFEDYIVNDLSEYIDANYKTTASRNKRAIMGHSMGGYGAMKIALKHPDKYCAVASHSGPLDFSHWPDRIPGVVSENGGVPVSEYVPTPDRLQTYLFYTLAGAFSPNLDNSPYPVDFPIDSMGNPIDSVFNRWLLNDPASLAAEMDRSSHLAIYFDCGEQDELLTYPFNTGFADSLYKLGMAYDFQYFTGGHIDQLATRLPISLQFLDSVMNKIGRHVEEGVWTYKTPMPTARCFLGACVLKGKIYAMGGATNASTVTSVLEVYDPLTDTWVQKASMPVALCCVNVAVLGEKIYVFGGKNAVFGEVLTDAFAYDPNTDEWTQIDDSPHNYGGSIAAIVGSRVYLIGGAIEGSNIPIPDVNVFDPVSETWMQKTEMPTPRSLHAACVYDSTIYCLGGTTENWASVLYSKVEVYDPLQDTWTEKNDMPIGRWGLAACQLDNVIFVTGGFDGQNSCDRLDILNPIYDIWTLGTPMQQTRRGHATCVLDGKIYVLGGSYTDNSAPAFLSSIEVYNYETKITGPYDMINDYTSWNFHLRQNYPNPFSANTSISFSLQSRQMVSLRMFDSHGRLVSVLVNEVKPPGEYTLTFSSGDLTEGIYFLHFAAGDYLQTNKCVLLRQY
jgi:S-formylglutathione hydrolase FrmB/N-acetylneuraminic acid mutarotase